jgi:hypothetical protein
MPPWCKTNYNKGEMMNPRFAALLVPALLLISGCSQQVIKSSELKKPNRFAIVSVTGMTSGFGMSENEEINLLSKVDEVVSKELNQSKDFRMVSSSLVKQSHSYAAIKGQSADGMFTGKVANGYKKFDVTDNSEAANLKKLMSELKLTGVIQITAAYTLKNSGLSVSGFLPVPIPVSVGSASGHVNLAIVVVNNANEVIWRDMVEVTSKDSIGKVMGIGNTAALYPKLVDISQEAVRTAINNLDEKLK